MSEKFTSVQIPGSSGYAARGHVSRDEAIAEAKRHYDYELLRAETALAAIRRGDVTVYHQIGIYRVKNRREVL